MQRTIKEKRKICSSNARFTRDIILLLSHCQNRVQLELLSTLVKVSKLNGQRFEPTCEAVDPISSFRQPRERRGGFVAVNPLWKKEGEDVEVEEKKVRGDDEKQGRGGSEGWIKTEWKRTSTQLVTTCLSSRVAGLFSSNVRKPGPFPSAPSAGFCLCTRMPGTY